MAKMNPMVSLELDDEDIMDMDCPLPIERSKRACFPYGLQICLTDKELDKLNLDASEAFVGGMIHLHAMARITCMSSNEMQDGNNSVRLEMQIEDMCVESEDEENYEEDSSMNRGMSAMYDRKRA